MSSAIQNKIKTEYSTYLVKKTEYDNATEDAKAILKPYRLSDNSVSGTQEEIESDVKLPETRIKAIPEVGTESSSGNLECEWNIDEQDDLLASVFCSSWDETDWDSSAKTGKKTLASGTARDIYCMIKKYNQEPKAWEMFNGIQIDSVSITMALNSIVKMSFALLGSNNPVPVLSDPTVNAEYGDALTTKAFITKELAMNIKPYSSGDELSWTFTEAQQMRQCPSFELSVSNNKERTDALGEKEAIEMSDGDFVVEGTFECWNADKKAISLKADAISGKDKLIEMSVFRTYGGFKTTYSIQLIAHLKTPSESKDGSKLKYSIPFSVNTENGIKIVKTVEAV